jgi:hypothetical protein
MAWIFIPFGNLLCSFVVWIIYRNHSRIASESVSAFKFQSEVFIISIACYFLTFLYLGFTGVIIIALTAVSITIVSTLRALVGYKTIYPFQRAGGLRIKCQKYSIALLALFFLPLFFFRIFSPEITVTLDDPTKEKYSDVDPSAEPIILERDSTLAVLAEKVYGGSWESGPKHWKRIAIAQNNWSGFYAEAYRFRSGDIVITYRGTEGHFNDIFTDLSMLLGFRPAQFIDGQKFYDIISQSYKIRYVVGHSLGGAIAQFVAASRSVDGLTINAFGAAPLVPPKMLSKWHQSGSSDRVLNVKSTADVVSEAYFYYSLIDMIDATSDFLRGTYNYQHIGCVLFIQYGGYAEQKRNFPFNLIQSHFVNSFMNIMTTNDLIVSDEYRCSGPQNRLGMLLGVSKLK